MEAEYRTLGVRRTGDFLSKMTAILAATVMVICFIAEFTLPGRTAKEKAASGLSSLSRGYQQKMFSSKIAVG